MDLAFEILINAVPIKRIVAGQGLYVHSKRWRRGDIISIFPAESVGTFDGSEWSTHLRHRRTGYIFVTGMPEVGINRVRKKLSSKMRILRDGEAAKAYPDSDLVRLCAWRVVPETMPQSARDSLRANRYLTVTFAQFKQIMRKKVIVNKADETQDDETTQMLDGDL